MFDRHSSHFYHPEFGESLPQQIARMILESILKNELKPGDKLVEDDLSKKLNTSRAPVREALYLLQMEGIVERLPRRGTVIKTFTQQDINEYAEVLIGIIKLAFQFTESKWDAAHLHTLQQEIELLNEEYNRRSLMDYQIIAERILRLTVIVCNNKALLRYFIETVQILSVFSTVKWTEDTMDQFHPYIIQFAKAIHQGDLDIAHKHIDKALRDSLE